MAIVIPLPTAATSPVANPQYRGRYPRVVTHIRNGGVLRSKRYVLQQAMGESEARVQACRRHLQYAHEAYAEAQIAAAQLNQSTRRDQR